MWRAQGAPRIWNIDTENYRHTCKINSNGGELSAQSVKMYKLAQERPELCDFRLAYEGAGGVKKVFAINMITMYAHSGVVE